MHKAKIPQDNHKRWHILDVVVACTTIILVAVGVMIQVGRAANSTECDNFGNVHVINLQNDTFSTGQLNLQRCDMVRISNTSTDQYYRLAFGTHDRLIAYPGFNQQTLAPQEYFELTAYKAGTYTLHDHIRAKATLQLDVRR